MESIGGITVTSDNADRVVIQLRDEAYPGRLVWARLSPQQARQLSAALALKAHEVAASST